jgi:hypothetical protein
MCSISRWVQTKTSDPELGRAGAASVVYNDHILIVGGRKNEELCLDVLSYDTATASLKCLSKGCPMGRPRAYASATLLGDVVWVVGGGGANDIMPDALCFNVLTREWVKPRLRRVSSPCRHSRARCSAAPLQVARITPRRSPAAPPRPAPPRPAPPRPAPPQRRRAPAAAHRPRGMPPPQPGRHHPVVWRVRHRGGGRHPALAPRPGDHRHGAPAAAA